MRDYQRIRNNPYYLPRSLYRRVLSVIRDYDRQKSEIENAIYEQKYHEISVDHKNGNPTQCAASKIERYSEDIRLINRAKSLIPDEYMTPIFDNIRYGTRFPDTAHYNTWSRWKMKFIYAVAVNFNLI